MLSDQTKQWFDLLTRDRSENANMLEKPSMRGVHRSVIDKYSDQAHFIYELLQNADDVRATSVHFRLEETGVFFTHDGTIHFTLSNPQNEDEDTRNGTLGHINAITSIANSSKTASSIGKFGVGFKAVFQYTQTPHIFDPRTRFKIQRFIVPHHLDHDHSSRKPDETLFFFPFDHQSKSPKDSHDEIAEKLKSLEFPVLFLSNLKSVTFETSSAKGKYSKEVTRTVNSAETTIEWLTMTLTLNSETTTQRLVMFKRHTTSRHFYCVCYAQNEEGQLVPIDRPAFCFFPTKEVTALKFLVHAPFLLTDSREGIKAGEKHNQTNIILLAQLAADSLLFLRDEQLINDGILDIIPYDDSQFTALDDRRKLSFKPLFTAIKTTFQTEPILPAMNGVYSTKHQSFWASDTELVGLISDRQLAQLTGVKDAHWVFRSRGKKEVQAGNRKLADYIDGGDDRKGGRTDTNLIVSSLTPEDALRKITFDFITAQPHEWLHCFYLYLAERISYQRFVRNKPIFLDQNGMATQAFDEKDQPILFLPDDDIDGYKTVHPALMSVKASREFIERFGVKRPSLRDEIYNKILPAYKCNSAIDTAAHFAKFFRYYKECRNEEVMAFLFQIKNKNFVRGKYANDPAVYRTIAANLYFPFPDLISWFETKQDTLFLSLDEYRGLVPESDHLYLAKFFEQLGVRTRPSVFTQETSLKDLGIQSKVPTGKRHRHDDKLLDGCEQIIENISPARSILLWRMLANADLLHSLRGRHIWFHYSDQVAFFKSTEERRLLTEKWILNIYGEFCSAKDITLQTLSREYETTSSGATALINLLEIRDQEKGDARLTDDEARKIKLANEIEQSGLSPDEIQKAIDEARRKKSLGKQMVPGEESQAHVAHSMHGSHNNAAPQPASNNGHLTGRHLASARDSSSSTEDNEDSDEFTPRSIDYGKRLQRLKERHVDDVNRIEYEQSLYEKANYLPRYSYGWVLALLELECLAGDLKYIDGKSILISFGKIERDLTSSRSVILKEPSRPIPNSIEDVSGVRVDFDYGMGHTGKLRIESFTAREFSLLGKLESEDDLEDVSLGDVVEARIEVQNPSFLLRELLERFRELKYDDDFDMKAGLAPQIEFVFGPPGTGKTTYLVGNVLLPLMRQPKAARVLVLTPTNKAADVLTTRLIEKMGGDKSYLRWLIRFGTSSDDAIEQSGVLRNRCFDFDSFDRSVTVTTIARFAYDGFSGATGKRLREISWDYVVFDEASMIPLASIMYPLYAVKPTKFVIAGDPFQIEPIVAVEQWKNENIYGIVGLNQAGSFASPATGVNNYMVTSLKVQYRSIPAIGDLFSRFTYDGILEHFRSGQTQRPLRLDGFDAKALNIIKFPVKKYESIYRPKRLDSGTPYQAYSALFTFEFVRWLGLQIQGGLTTKCRIGVIAPYRAQACLLSRLNDSWLTKPDTLEILVGTIHGFQGDECDIIVAVFNPPPVLSRSPKMFLNRQNILNVAISRARDYLFIIMPDDNTDGITKLHQLVTIERLVKAGGVFSEYSSEAVEELIWGKKRFLEENTFSTGHQMVNVYRRPERLYEVRSDDFAIDVQVHEKHQS